MMDSGFFVGRREIVDWVNETLKLNLTKVEQTASGRVVVLEVVIIASGR
jgi:RP/EB family microtubule-associated protein